MTENFEFIGDKDYKGCKYVKLCEDKQEKSKRQIIEAVNSQIKNFNLVSRWRKIKTFVAYLYAYAIDYSFFRKSKLWGVISHPRYIRIKSNTVFYLTYFEIQVGIAVLSSLFTLFFLSFTILYFLFLYY